MSLQQKIKEDEGYFSDQRGNVDEVFSSLRKTEVKGKPICFIDGKEGLNLFLRCC
jgi:hypothetical protein